MQLVLSAAFALALAASSVSAFATDYKGSHKFVAPGPGDERSPCPGLNTLANHGYLPHNGKNFTVKTLMDASLKGFNVDWDAILIAAKFGMLSRNDFGSIENMSLGALSLHNLVEHDASISRNDFGDGTGDHIHFNETTFSVMANANPGVDYYNTTSAAAVQYARLQHSKETNPFLVNTKKEFVLRSHENSLYLSIFGDPLTGIAPKKFVQIFFREERLPVQEGWKLPTTKITAATLSPLDHAIRDASNWTETSVCGPVVLSPTSVVNDELQALLVQ
ncbi:HEME-HALOPEROXIDASE domain-containing protein [Mycena indigotica]|uniref:HEME-HALOPEROXIDASE domain-containing protein n=1 Tax=Mycena indigotica TaxID=2126181 RepID=A0A8H6SRM8_9AGAR|nr:HEME-HALOPEROXIDASE domain-containing protein [Mycena indigotica]KAF7304159.1 HEME-HALOPEROXIDASE domain-containing protein [Mycena indigotica]